MCAKRVVQMLQFAAINVKNDVYSDELHAKGVGLQIEMLTIKPFENFDFYIKHNCHN